MAQALHLANGSTINEKLRSDASVTAKAVTRNDGDREILDRLFFSALSRPPTESERERLLKILKDSVSGLTDPKAIATTRRQAAEDLYWAVLTSQEFLFNH